MLGAFGQFLSLGLAVWAIASLAGVGQEIAISLALLIGILAGLFGWWRTKNRLFTAKELSAKPFNGKLPYEVGMATETAIALGGDDQYSQRVVGTLGFSENFEDLRRYAGVPDGSTFEVQCALVIEPANPNSRHAVAVTCGGVVLGYIPEFESQSLFDFLKTQRGMARVNADIYFECASGRSAVELDLVRPYRIVPGV